MPWTPSSFRTKHNHSLSDMQANEAARVANGMMKAGVPEGEAIATANARAEGKPRHDIRHPKTGRFIPARTNLRHAVAGGKGTRPTQ